MQYGGLFMQVQMGQYVYLFTLLGKSIRINVKAWSLSTDSTGGEILQGYL